MLLGTETTFERAEILGFGYGEHLLVWSWRRIAASPGPCPIVVREFADACGDDAAEVLATLCTFLRALAFAGRRRLLIAFPGCVVMTEDEQRVLALLAAAQNNDAALFEAHLRWLARADVRHILAIGARALAAALTANHLCLAEPSMAIEAPLPCSREKKAS